MACPEKILGSALAIVPQDIFWWRLVSPHDGTTHGRTTDK